jgi:alkylation response protein AidB-like acyl-CoA dehydrogenase
MTILGIRRRPDSPATLDEARDSIRAVLARLSEGAADRDLSGEHPYELVQALAEAGFGRLRVPAVHGGFDVSLPVLFEFLAEAGQADSNIPQIWRGHFTTTEILRAEADDRVRAKWLRAIGDGAVFGNAQSEPAQSEPAQSEPAPAVTAPADSSPWGAITTRVRAEPGGRLLVSGRKFYSTGARFADYIRAAVADENGDRVFVVVPARHPGVTHVDDWDGIGQRETGSGTTLLEHVLVHPDEVTDAGGLVFLRRGRGSQAQLLLHAIAAGILRSAVTDTAELLRTRGRAYSWGNAESAREDPQLLAVVGSVAAAAYVVEAAVLAAADAQERAAAYAEEHGEASEELEQEASLQAAKVKVGVEDLALKAAGDLYNAGGASWTRSGTHLDRHWRNLRTLFSHNPTVYKARVIGDVVVNGNPLPPVGFF